MHTPGFTAESSLYQSGGGYRAPAGRAAGWAGAPAVVPQLARQLDLLNCLQGCSVAGSDPGCQETCFRMADIRASDDFAKGGRPRPRQQSDLVCGPCRNGRQRCVLPGVGSTTGPCVED